MCLLKVLVCIEDIEEMSSEEAVGILAYANSCPGFRGILKQRLVLLDRHYPLEERGIVSFALQNYMLISRICFATMDIMKQ